MKRFVATPAGVLLGVLLGGMLLFGARLSASEGALYIIFDGSNSMWGELPDKSRKIAVAKRVFNTLDPALFTGREVALRLYGHRKAGDCADAELAVAFAGADEALAHMSEKVNGVSPRGKTPITRSLRAALADFGDRAGDILLISDGIETCDTDPCDLVREWRAEGVKIRVHVVGLGLNEQSRGAMQCIAEASETQYFDANTAGELAQAIETAAVSKPAVSGEAAPKARALEPEFRIKGEDENGLFVPVAGTLLSSGQVVETIKSNARYVFAPGEYTVTVGVPTASGAIYAPVTQDIIEADDSTLVTLQVTRPPLIRTHFVENGEETRGAVAIAYENGVQAFVLRPNEEYFVLPGTYEFMARLNKDNDLSVTETVAAGEDKIIVFTAAHTVRERFAVFAEGSEEPLGQHQELLQDGEVKYKVHVHNGADIKPGTYTLRSTHPLTPYEVESVDVGKEDKQLIELQVPMGSAKLEYVFLETPAKNDRRCWLERLDAENERVARSKGQRCDGSVIPLSRGRYKVIVWGHLGEFEDTIFDVIDGQMNDVQIQQTAVP